MKSPLTRGRRLWRGNLASILRGNVGIAVLGLTTGLVLARVLEPEGRGLLAIALVWPGIATTLIGLPGNSAVSFFSARYPELRGGIVRTSLWMSLLSSGVIIVLGVAGSLLVRGQGELFTALLIAFASTPFMLIVGVGRGLLKAQSGHLKRWSRWRLVQPAAYIALVGAFATSGQLSVVSASAAFLASQVVTASWIWLAFLRKAVAGERVDGPMRRDVLVYGVKTSVAGSAQLTNGRLDVAVIGLVVPISDVGFYAVAASIAQYIVPLATAAAPWVFPRLARADPTLESWSAARRALWISAVMAAAGAAAMAALAPVILGRVLGEEWLPALVPLWILLGGAIVQAVRQTLISVASAYNRPGLTAQSEGLAAIVTVVALWPMVQLLGINGAAIVSVVAYSISAALLYRGVVRAVQQGSTARLEDVSSESDVAGPTP